MALLPSLATQIQQKYPVEKITHELQAKRAERIIAADELTTPSGSLNESVQSLASDSTASLAGSTSSLVASTASLTASGSVKTKTQLWRELKILSLTRAMTLIYSSALLVFFTRLQLNILGRKNYVASVIHMAEQRNKESDDESTDGLNRIPSEAELARLSLEEEELKINRMYLTFSWWLLNKGWASLSERIEDAVTEVFDSINPRSDLSLAEVSELIGHVQHKIDNGVGILESNNFSHNLLPPTELETYVLAQAPVTPEDGPCTSVKEPLRLLLDETSDFIESPNAVDVIQRLVHSGLSMFVDKLMTIYPQPTGDAPAKVKLASILANVTKQSQALSAGKPFEPNEYILSMISVPELDGFSALVYSNFTGLE
jgi:peroxin-3